MTAWASAVGGSTTTFDDDFNRADGAVGNGWVIAPGFGVPAGTWAIASNQLSAVSTGGALVRDLSGVDLDVRITMVGGTSTSNGIVLRYDPLNLGGSFFLVRPGDAYSFQGGTGGSFTSLGTWGGSGILTGPGVFRVTLSGTTVNVYRGDDPTVVDHTFSISSMNETSTTHGVWSGGSGQTFDDFMATASSPATDTGWRVGRLAWP